MRVCIAGAGIMGLVLAYYLSHAGFDIAMVDDSSSNNCSSAAAGLLTPVAELEKSEVIIYHMGVQSLLRYWPEILAELPTDIYFSSKGSVAIAHPHDKAELHSLINRLKFKQADAAITSLNRAELADLEPDLSKFADGFYFGNEGQVDNQQVLLALKAWLLSRNVVFHDSHLAENQIDDLKHQYDFIFDCRGLGAKSIFQDLRGIRGELIWLHAPHVHISRPVRFYHPRYNLYIVPRPDQIYLIGASEIEAEDYSPISVRTTLELMSAVYSIHSGFAESRVIKSVTQCRPTLKNHSPQIKTQENVIALNGLYRHGFLIAPALAAEVMCYLKSGHDDLLYPQLWEAA
jgi:glycine oxidase